MGREQNTWDSSYQLLKKFKRVNKVIDHFFLQYTNNNSHSF